MNGDTVSIEVVDGGWVMRFDSNSGSYTKVFTDLLTLMRDISHRVSFDAQKLRIEMWPTSGSGS